MACDSLPIACLLPPQTILSGIIAGVGKQKRGSAINVSWSLAGRVGNALRAVVPFKSCSAAQLCVLPPSPPAAGGCLLAGCGERQRQGGMPDQSRVHAEGAAWGQRLQVLSSSAYQRPLPATAPAEPLPPRCRWPVCWASL